MKTRILSMLSAMALTSGFAQAQSLDTDAALDLARQFFASHNSGASHRAPAQVAPVLSYTATTEGMPDFYVFNRGNGVPGYVIINADGASDTPILAYSTSTTFDYDTAPNALRWWLAQYQAYGVAKVPARAGASRHDVGPLVKTKWNQNAPFNEAIPLYNNGYDPFVTGCTATAMAQLMKFHEHPTQGTGSYSYTVTYGSKPIVYSADFGATTYDWDNMLDDYSQGYTDAQGRAVATLMYHAGVSETTIYNWQSNGGSSADDRHAAQGLINNFGYDKSMRRGVRNHYTDSEWDNIIYDELAAGRPLMYSGSSDEGGHTFICDGYDAVRHLFHINWGWGGYCDDYFALTGSLALTPNGTGIGGGPEGSAYTNDQTINYNIRPDEGGQPIVQPILLKGGELSTTAGGSAIPTYSVNRSGSGADRTLYLTLSPQNDGFHDASFDFGIVLRSTIDGYIYGSKYGTANNLPAANYYVASEGDNTPLVYNAPFSTSVAPYNGTYEVLPGYRENASSPWRVMPYDLSMTVPTITITGGTDAQPVELPLDITAAQVEVGKTIAITHHPYYSGTITYTSSNPSVATVASDGTITGRGIGTVTITATSTADAHFKATTKVFTVEVLSHIMHNADVTLSKKRFTVGETASISVGGGYEGEVTYSVAPVGVVSVSPTGVVTALAEGEAIITVNVAGNADYNAATKHFEVTVSNVPPAPAEPGFCMDSYPYAGEDNIVTSTDMTLHIPLYNSSESSIEPATFYVRMYYNGGYVTWTCGFGNTAYPSGYHHDYAINPIEKGLKENFTPGNVYKYEFYIDEECNKPMNVPSLTYYYCPDNASVSTLANFIDDAKKGNGATVKLIKALVNKLLGK